MGDLSKKSDNNLEQSDLIEIVDGPIEVDRIIAQCQESRSGAICVFVGTTRQFTKGVETEYLEYESHREMALAQMKLLVQEVRGLWPVNRCAAIHRLGRVDIAEPSIVVAVSSPHRKESFEACESLVDRIKTEVAIWKREYYKDQPAQWVHPTTDA